MWYCQLSNAKYQIKMDQFCNFKVNKKKLFVIAHIARYPENRLLRKKQSGCQFGSFRLHSSTNSENEAGQAAITTFQVFSMTQPVFEPQLQ